MKTADDYIYLAVWNALQPMASICVTGLDELEEHETEIMIADDTYNPEKILLKKDAFDSLSDEAKYLLRIILDAPQELIEVLYTQKYKKTSKARIKKFLLKRLHWNRLKVNKAFREIKKYLREEEII